ncbi:hypothetical protein XENTR_v10022440 [Xenopus tropicalis]|nr:hypothetical protein XENTR_v10022440 [Xenopus tropicalis]
MAQQVQLCTRTKHVQLHQDLVFIPSLELEEVHQKRFSTPAMRSCLCLIYMETASLVSLGSLIRTEMSAKVGVMTLIQV